MVCIIIGLIMENNNNIFYKYIYCLILNLVIFFKIVIYFLYSFFFIKLDYLEINYRR